jgi:hypothetical protein
VIDRKVDALDAHVSQFCEWLPWVDGKLNEVPKDRPERKAWLKRSWITEPTPAIRDALVKWFGEKKANAINYPEAFEICEYRAHPGDARLRQFPMLR